MSERAEIQHFALTSSWLTSGVYDPVKQTLDVMTSSGRSYTSYNVPPEEVAALRAASSAGTYWRENIKDQYA